jgi:hypothetical protein
MSVNSTDSLAGKGFSKTVPLSNNDMAFSHLGAVSYVEHTISLNQLKLGSLAPSNWPSDSGRDVKSSIRRWG